MKLPLLKKWTFLQARKCPTLGWDLRHGAKQDFTVGERFRMAEGSAFGDRIHATFSGGVLVSEKNPVRAVAETKRLMAKRSVKVIFEAAFLVNKKIIARADVLERVKGGWRLLEVKSAMKYKRDLVYDLAYTATVMSLAGVTVVASGLVMMNQEYRLGMSDEHLYRRIDCTNSVARLVRSFSKRIIKIEAETAASKRPVHVLTKHCKKSLCFVNDCRTRIMKHHIFEVPRLSQKKLDDLNAIGAEFIKDIPADFWLTNIQDVVYRAVLALKPQISWAALSYHLSMVEGPISYMDFESMLLGVPIWKDVAPYVMCPTQYSLHVCDTIGSKPWHREYLADASKNCSREFTERLLNDLPDKGSIMVYSSFEKSMLTRMGKLFPDLKPALDRLVPRLFDLERVLRPGCVYHPGFKGRSSLKATLPVMVPNLSHSGLAIANGDTAVVRYAEMARGQVPAADVAQIRQDLLDYCKIDTLAMVELHTALIKLSKSRVQPRKIQLKKAA